MDETGSPFGLIKQLIEYNNQNYDAHGFKMEVYFRFHGVKRQPRELLNHTDLCKQF